MLLTCSFQTHKNQILLLKSKQIPTLPTTLGSPALPGEQALNLALYFLQLLGERGLLWESPVTAGSAGCADAPVALPGDKGACSRASIKAKLPESSACSGISLRGNSEWGVPPRADLGPGRTGKLQLLEPSPALDITAGHSGMLQTPCWSQPSLCQSFPATRFHWRLDSQLPVGHLLWPERLLSSGRTAQSLWVDQEGQISPWQTPLLQGQLLTLSKPPARIILPPIFGHGFTRDLKISFHCVCHQCHDTNMRKHQDLVSIFNLGCKFPHF